MSSFSFPGLQVLYTFVISLLNSLLSVFWGFCFNPSMNPNPPLHFCLAMPLNSFNQRTADGDEFYALQAFRVCSNRNEEMLSTSWVWTQLSILWLGND